MCDMNGNAHPGHADAVVNEIENDPRWLAVCHLPGDIHATDVIVVAEEIGELYKLKIAFGLIPWHQLTPDMQNQDPEVVNVAISIEELRARLVVLGPEDLAAEGVV